MSTAMLSSNTYSPVSAAAAKRLKFFKNRTRIRTQGAAWYYNSIARRGLAAQTISQNSLCVLSAFAFQNDLLSRAALTG